MSKVIAPILLLIAAIGLFFTYLRPAYDILLAFQAQEKELDQAITDSKTLLERHNRLLTDYSSISSENRARLDKMLPDSIDIVQMVIDIDVLTAVHNIRIESFEIPQIDTNAVLKNPRDQQGLEDEGPVGSAVLTVELTGEYADFKAFLLEIEQSLALTDVVKIDIEVEDITQPGTEEGVKYTLGLQTYWFK